MIKFYNKENIILMMNKLEHEFRSEENKFLFEEIKSIKTASVKKIKLQYKILNKNYFKCFYDKNLY